MKMLNNLLKDTDRRGILSMSEISKGFDIFFASGTIIR